jgi:hypothetical protein
LSNEPDYALIRIRGAPGRRVARLVSKVLSAGMPIRMIHHPEGQRMVISRAGRITQAGEDYIAHDVPTADGSSGAPILDRNWEMIAIHRGTPGMGRTLPKGSTEGVSIGAIWDRMAPHLT